MEFELNEFQTPIELLGLDSLQEEVVTEFYDCIRNIPFIKRLISKDRKRAKDLPRDEEGRIIVDLANPHILEDMDYFRPAALHYKKTGRYTDFRPNSNPNSLYMKWLKEEIRRCWYGYVRESDGEWVTGNMYFYLNYHLIEITDDSSNNANTGDSKKRKLKGQRRADFPDCWEGVYWRFHYIELAMYGGMYDNFEGGKGGCEISSRGKSKSFSMAAMVDKYFTLGESEEVKSLVKSLVVASTKEYLDADGILNKFETACDFLIQRQELQFPKRRIKSSIKDLEWQMGYYDLNTGTKRGTLNQVLGVATKDDIGKVRGKRSQLIVVEEFGNFSNVLEMYNIMKPSWIEGDIAFGFIYMIGTSSEKESDFAGAAEIVYNPTGYRMYGLPNVWDIDGLGKKWITFFFPSYINYKGYYNHDGVSDVTASLLRILLNRYEVKYNTSDINSITREIAERPITPQEVLTRARNSFFPVAQLNERINQLDNNQLIYDEVYIGDLAFNKDNKVEFVPTAQEPIRTFPLSAEERTDGALEIYEMPQTNSKGEIPDMRYIMGCLLPGEKVNTDRGLVPVELITMKDKLVNKDGDFVDIVNLLTYYNEDPVYKVKLSTIYDTTTFSKEHPIYCATPEKHYRGKTVTKRTGLPQKYYKYDFQFKKVKDLKVGDVVKSPNVYNKVIPFYDRWVDNARIDRKIKNPLHNPNFWWMIGLLLGDGWVCGNGYNINCSFNSKEKLYILKYKNCIKTIFGRSIALAKNYDNYKEYSFCCQEFNRFFGLNFGIGAKNKNLPEWVKYIDKEYKKQLILGYLASDGSVTNNGIEFVSVSKKMLNDFQDILFSLGLQSSVTKLRDKRRSFIIDRYCLLQETYHLRISKVASLRIKQWNKSDLKLSKIDYVYNEGNAKHDIRNTWFSDDLKYIYFKVKDIEKVDYIGNVYNFECNTHTFMCNYIPTHNCDPIDQDYSETVSLYSIFVLDLFTDRVVAEYTGRPMFADLGHEMARKLCIFYNATLCFESNLKGIYGYFQKYRCMLYLCNTPEYLKERNLVKITGYGNVNKGIRATAPINNYANQLIKDWLMTPVTTIGEVDGVELEITVPQLYTLKNRALLKELVLFNPKINVDRIRAFGMLMLYREQFVVMYEGNLDRSQNEDEYDATDPANDEFFIKNYRPYNKETYNKKMFG